MRDWLRVEIRISARPCVASDAQTERRVQAAPARAETDARCVSVSIISRIMVYNKAYWVMFGVAETLLRA